MIPILPPEIIDYISDFLLQKDFYQLILVNHNYYANFILKLYRKVELDDEYKIGPFLHATKHHSSIQCLSLNFNSYRYQSMPQAISGFPMWACYGVKEALASSSSYFAPFQDLNSLTIGIADKHIALSDVLKFMPNIKRLTIEGKSEFELSVDWLNEVLRICPRLTYLSISTCCVNPPTKEELEDTQPFDQLKTFRLLGGYTWCHGASYHITHCIMEYPLWLYYVANHFPSLEALTVDSGSSWVDKTIRTFYPTEFFDWFHSQCPNLVYFEYCNVVPSDEFVYSLNDQQRKLFKFSLTSAGSIKQVFFEQEEEAETNYSYMSTLSNFKASTQFGMSCHGLVNVIASRCLSLEQLELHYEYSDGSGNRLNLDTLLESFPCLTTLVLHGFDICLNQQNEISQSYLLKKICFENCRLTDHVFDYLAPRCLDLQYLALKNVLFIDQHYGIRIRLPYQELVEIDLQSVHIHSTYHQENVHLFHLEQRDRADWYLAHDTNRTVIRKRSTRADMETFDMILSQLRTLWLEPEYQLGCTYSLPSSAFDGWDVCKMIEQGYMLIVCPSVHSIYIQK